MPKATNLEGLDLTGPAISPAAATAPRAIPSEPRKRVEKSKNDTAVNVRWPAVEVKAMKRAALDRDMTLQDYLLACFHAFEQNK